MFTNFYCKREAWLKYMDIYIECKVESEMGRVYKQLVKLEINGAFFIIICQKLKTIFP